MNRHERRGGVFEVILTVFVLILGASFIALGGWSLYDDWRANTQFLPVQATIITSEVGVREKRGRDRSTTYYPDITFSYEVDGTVHTTGEYRIQIASSSGRSAKRKIVRRHPAGSKHEAWYDPDHPSVAVLNRNYNVIGFVFGGVGIALPSIVIAVMVTRARRARSRRAALHDWGISASGHILPQVNTKRMKTLSDGRVRLIGRLAAVEYVRAFHLGDTVGQSRLRTIRAAAVQIRRADHSDSLVWERSGSVSDDAAD